MRTMVPVCGAVNLPLMNQPAGRQTDSDNPLLAEQLELLGTRKREVEALISRGDRVAEPLIDDVVGIVLVLRAALLTNGTARPDRAKLEGYEREARELLSLALNHRY